MRKLFSLMLVVLGTAALVSCSKDDDDDVLREGEGVITFVTKAKSLTSEGDNYLYLETFNEGEKITIDWGDGSKEVYVPVREESHDNGETQVWYEIKAEYTYAGKSSHTVTVRGKIKWFYVSSCEVTSIDVTKCPALEELYCDDNQLTSLDVSGCTALERLGCSSNQLTSLDVSKNTALERLSCYENQLTSLDVSKNTALEKLWCYECQLTSLNINGCTELYHIECHKNRFSASAMNKIYNDLPQGKVDEYGYNRSELYCDKLGDYSIAEKKGWNVY